MKQKFRWWMLLLPVALMTFASCSPDPSGQLANDVIVSAGLATFIAAILASVTSGFGPVYCILVFCTPG